MRINIKIIIIFEKVYIKNLLLLDLIKQIQQIQNNLSKYYYYIFSLVTNYILSKQFQQIRSYNLVSLPVLVLPYVAAVTGLVVLFWFG